MSPVSTTASPSSRGSLVIGRRRPEDREPLEDMYREVFGDEAAEQSRQRWRWQYEENPHCPPEGPEIWVAKEDGRVLGQYATMPVRLKVADRILRASWGMDVMVRPDLQRKGVGSRLFVYWDKQVEASLGLGLSKASHTLFQKLQWKDVGPVPCYTRILDPKPLVARRLGQLAALGLSPVARAVLSLLFPVRPSASGPSATHVVPLEGPFDDSFDDLWEAVSPEYDFVAERKARYLEWKYRKVPYVRYEIYRALRGGELTGYVVLRATERHGVRLGMIVDWLAHPDDTEALDALVDRAAAWGQERQVARLQTFTFDQRLIARLERKGFFRIGSPMQFCLRIHSDHMGPGYYEDTSRWHVTFGDSDQDRDP